MKGIESGFSRGSHGGIKELDNKLDNKTDLHLDCISPRYYTNPYPDTLSVI